MRFISTASPSPWAALLVSTLVGLLYGAMLPMFPRRPIVLGGLIVPVLWSGLLYPTLGLLNPLLASHIDWFWFIASQMAFGIVAGAVVVRQSRIPTLENVSFALRAGIEAPGTISPRGRDTVVTPVRCLSASTMLVAMLGVLLWLRHSARPASRRLDPTRTERGRGIRRVVCRQLRRLSRHQWPGRSGDRARQPGVPRDRRRTVDPHDHRRGVRGTSMPAFAQRAGGMLTEKQIDAIVSGIRSRWSDPGALDGANPPSYAATSAGDIHRGEAVYQTFCESCHGKDGRGGAEGKRHHE